MKKEVVTFTPSGIPEPYNTYISERNANVGGHLAKIQGIEFTGEYTDSQLDTKHKYYVPAKTLQSEIAEELGIRTSQDLYGGVVEHHIFATKAILHPTLYPNSPKPNVYPANFTTRIVEMGLVLPGYTTFDPSFNEAQEIFNRLQQQGFNVRLKEPDQSDGDGQLRVADQSDLAKTIARYHPEYVVCKGIVLEANMEEATTVSVGQTTIAGRDYSHIAFQKDIRDKGRTMYGGAVMRIFRKGLDHLAQNHFQESHIAIAVQQSYQMYEAYGDLDPKLSRASFDILQGYDARGNFSSGVTDQTFRLGGSSPAEVLAIEYLNTNPNADFIDAEVTLDYDPKLPIEKLAEVFLNQPTLRITAKLMENDKRT